MTLKIDNKPILLCRLSRYRPGVRLLRRRNGGPVHRPWPGVCPVLAGALADDCHQLVAVAAIYSVSD